MSGKANRVEFEFELSKTLRQVSTSPKVHLSVLSASDGVTGAIVQVPEN
jgi:hypothetical protein